MLQYDGGVPSTPNFGLYIPFQATIAKWPYITTATGTARFNLVNYDASDSAMQRFPLDFTSPRKCLWSSYPTKTL